MKLVSLRTLFIVLAVILLPSGQALAEKRVALVIGNSAYKDVPLANPVNDAKLMIKTLRGLGFEVLESLDADQQAMKLAVTEFGDRLEAAGKDAVGLFYYAGHGVQVGGTNYLIPVGANIYREKDVDIFAVSANAVLSNMEFAGNRVNIVIMDACRNNPFKRSFRSAARGLAKMNAATGTLIGYATAPGEVAADGSGGNSPYTLALSRAMNTPGLTVERMFKQVRNDVRAETNNRQTPWEASSLTGADFYFKGGGVSSPQAQTGRPSPSAAPQVDEKALDLAFWNSIKDSTDASMFEAYLEQYPKGSFAVLARAKVKKFGKQQVAVVPPPKPPPVSQSRPKAQPDPHSSAALFSWARKLANNKPNAMRTIAKFLAKSGDIEAALRMVRNIKDKKERDSGLREVANTLSEAREINRALEVAHAIPSGENRDLALKRISRIQSNDGDNAGALRTLGDVSDIGMGEYLLYIASNQAKSGDIEGAFSMTSQIPDPYYRTHGLYNIAHHQLMAGDRAGARSTVRKSLDLSGDIENKSHQEISRERAVGLLAMAGDRDGALSIATGLSDEVDRVRARAMVLAGSGDVEGALRTVKDIQDTNKRDIALWRVSNFLEGKERWDQALKVAERVSNPVYRASAFSSRFFIFNKKGDAERARLSLQRALAASREITRDEGRAFQLALVGRDYANFGDLESARQILREAYGVAMLLNPSNRENKLRYVAEYQTVAGDVVGARRSLADAIAAAEEDNKHNSEALAKDLAELAAIIAQLEKIVAAPTKTK